VRYIEIGTGGWDHHFDIKLNLPVSCQAIDKPIGALLADLRQRGLLEDTLVVSPVNSAARPQAKAPTVAITTTAASPSGWPAAA
jgi:hypothetical protein